MHEGRRLGTVAWSPDTGSRDGLARTRAKWLLLAAAGLLQAHARAADQVKKDNTQALSNIGSWVGGALPGATDWAIWDSTMTADRSAGIGADQTWGAIKVTNAVFKGTIGNTSGKTLTLNGIGGVGIDLSQATADFTVNCLLKLGASVKASVAAGRSLSVGATTLTLNGNTLTFDGAGSSTFSGATAADSGAFEKSGSGLLILTGANAHSGGFTLSGGVLAVNNNAALGTGTLTMNGGVCSNNATRVLANPVALAAPATFAAPNGLTLLGEVSGTGPLVKEGAGALTLVGANTYSGDTVINAGSVNVSNDWAFGSVAGKTVVTNGANVLLYGNVTVAESALVGNGSAMGVIRSAAGSNTWSGDLLFAYVGRLGALAGCTLRVTGPIALQSSVNYLYFAPSPGGVVVIDSIVAAPGRNVNFLGGDGGTNVLNATGGDWSSGRIYYGSTVVLGADNVLPVGASLNFGGSDTQRKGTLAMNGKNQMIGSLTSSTVSNAFDDLIANDSPVLSTLTVNQNSVSTFGGVLQGNLALVKSGSGSLTLTNVNTYTGGTVIQGVGQLRVGAGCPSGTLGSGAITNNGVLVYNRSDDFAVGNAIFGSGALIKDGPGALTLTATNAFSGSTQVSNGTLFVAGGLPGSSVNVASNAAVGASGTANAQLQSLTLAEGAVVRWNYDQLGRRAGCLSVSGNLTLPASAKLVATGAASMYSDWVVFSADSLSGAKDLSGWTLEGVPDVARLVIVQNQVIVHAARGTVVLVN